MGKSQRKARQAATAAANAVIDKQHKPTITVSLVETNVAEQVIPETDAPLIASGMTEEAELQINRELLALDLGKPPETTISAVADATEQVEQSQPLSLLETYQQRKSAQSTVFNFFTPVSPERLQAIAFVTSVLDNLDRTVLSEKTCEEITYGAYTHVLNDIKSSYKGGWVSTNPKSSQLFSLLSEKLDGKTSDLDKLNHLSRLHLYLKTDAVREKINFGTKLPDSVLDQISTEIDNLSPKSAAVSPS